MVPWRDALGRGAAVPTLLKAQVVEGIERRRGLKLLNTSALIMRRNGGYRGIQIRGHDVKQYTAIAPIWPPCRTQASVLLIPTTDVRKTPRCSGAAASE
jgi:hypothetical protein